MEGPEIAPEEQNTPTRKGPGLIVVGFWIAMTGAILLRFRFLGQALQPGRIELFGADPWYHLRRATLIYEGFPDLAYQDLFHTFPNAESCSALPAGFGILLNLFAFIFPGESIAERISIAGLFLIPLLGILTVWLTYKIARRILSPAGALIALFAMALLPAAVDCSFAGRMDHHVLDPLVAVGLFFCIMRGLECREAPIASRKWGLLAGVVAFVGLASFPSALVTVGIVLGGGVLALFFVGIRGRDTKPLGILLGIAGITAGILHGLFLALCTPCFGSTALVANSLIPLILVFGCGLFPLGLTLFLERGDSTEAKQKQGWLLLIGTAMTGVLVLVIDNPIAQALNGWLAVMAGDLLPQLSEEWRPLFDTPVHWLNGKLSWGFTLVPIGIFLFVYRGIKSEATDPQRFLAGTCFALTVLLVLQMKYFIYLAAPFLCLAMARAMEEFARLASSYISMRFRKALIIALAIPLTGFLAYEPYTHYKATELTKWQTQETLDLLEWVRDNTPEVDPDDPEYGILNTWHTGFWIPTVAERPNFANNFVAAPPDSLYIQHLKSAYDWLLSEKTEALYEGMASNRLDYALIAPINGKAVRGYLSLADKRVGNLVSYHDELEQWMPNEAFNHTVLARLLLLQGRAVDRHPCIARLQLQNTTPSTMKLAGRDVPVAQFYRRVEGAIVRGHAIPGTTVKLGTRRFVVVEEGVPPYAFVFECTAKAEDDGSFEIRFPYPSTRVGNVVPASPILLIRQDPQRGGMPMQVEITAEAVTHGESVSIP